MTDTEAPENLPDAASDEAHQAADPENVPPLEIRGAELSHDELVALLSLLGSLRTDEDEGPHGAGSTGPNDRTLQRRRHLGLWGRPGADSWFQEAGLR